MIWEAISWEVPVGILLLAIGGDMLVRGAVQIARILSVSKLLIGITLVGFGTSMPELVTSVRAALLDSPGIAIGNVIGSNTSNILLVLGTAALIYPVATPRASVMRNGFAVFVATAVCIGVVIVGYLDRRVGGVLVALLLLYFLYSYFYERRAFSAQMASEADDLGKRPMSAWKAAALAILGTIFIILGARWLVDGAIDIARAYQVSETIIGLTLVAIGTSLPELITSVMAALRKETAIALGNVLGSNIQNILGILGVTAIIKPIPVPPEIIYLDIWVMAGATLALLIFAAKGPQLGRGQGFLLVLAYAGYISYLAYLALGRV